MEIAKQKLIIALDDLDFDSALKMAALTKPFAETFKVGLSLFSAHGPQIIKELNHMGVKVFLDLKLHDIPMQVAKAIDSVLSLSPRFITVHALGGKKMLQEAQNVVSGSNTALLAVTVLTSLGQEDYRDLGCSRSIEEGVTTLADLAVLSGIAGLVSSPHEVNRLRMRFLDRAVLVAPGVRPFGSDRLDQSRVMSPREAILAGADALVVGRPITKAINIVDAARHINQEIKTAVEEKNKTIEISIS